jgi:hypothetical protein
MSSFFPVWGWITRTVAAALISAALHCKLSNFITGLCDHYYSYRFVLCRWIQRFRRFNTISGSVFSTEGGSPSRIRKICNIWCVGAAQGWGNNSRKLSRSKCRLHKDIWSAAERGAAHHCLRRLQVMRVELPSAVQYPLSFHPSPCLTFLFFIITLFRSNFFLMPSY